MFRSKSATLACAVAISLSTSLHSQTQEPVSALDEIVIIANRMPVPIKQIGASVTIIDEADLLAHGNFSLNDVLRQTASVGGTSNGGAGSLSSIRIRGEEGFRTLMIFDGIKLSDPSGPQVATPVEHILTSGIGRVEVLRGPQGLSYGADAGGIVSISTRPTEDGFKVGIDGQSGSRSTQQLAANISGASEQADFALSATDYQSDGYNVRASDTVLADDDGYENTSVHARVGLNVGDTLRFELVHRDVEGETEYDGCFAGTTVHDCLAIFDQQASRLSMNYSGASFTHSLAYSNSETERDDLALGVSAFTSYGELERWEYVGSAVDLPGMDLVFGVDLESVDNGIDQRDNEGYFLEYLSDFSERLFLTAGVRQDENDDFGAHSTYRVSSAYLIDLTDSVIKLKASYGTGFRAPSLFEIAYNAGPFSFPPASTTSLSEETSEGLEFGVEYFASDDLRLELVVFDQEVQDAIYFDLASFSGYLQDQGTSTSQGVEVIGEYSFNRNLSVSANYTYNETQRPNGEQRLRRPEQLANFGINFQSSNQRLNINGFYRVSRDAIDEIWGTPVDLDDFEVLDITASYRFSDNIEVYGRLENALDEEYQEVGDFVSPDAASYLGIRLNF